MNRRSFLKTTAVTATTLPLVGCEFKPKTKSKWIAFKDQMPKPTDKFEMREVGKPHSPIRKGEILQFTDTTVSPPSRFDIGMEEDELPTATSTTTTKTFVMYKLTDNCNHCIRQDQWEWRYV